MEAITMTVIVIGNVLGYLGSNTELRLFAFHIALILPGKV